MKLRIEAQIVLAPGEAHPFGRTTALFVARPGAKVYACDAAEEGLEETGHLARSEEHA